LPEDKLPISIVNGLIRDAIEAFYKEKIEPVFTEIRKIVNDNSTATEERIKKIETAVSTLDSDFKADKQKKPFSLGFLDFDIE